MSGVEAVESLVERIRREGDLASRSGQMLRLYDIADELQEEFKSLRAQLEAAEAEVAKLSSANVAYSQQVNELIGRAGNAEARAEAAEAECARLRADAERYEFIRSASTPNVPELNVLAMGALDRAIDAAIARTKEQQA